MNSLEKNLLNGFKITVILIIVIRLFFVVLDNKFKEVQAYQEQKEKPKVSLSKEEMEIDTLLNGGREQEAFIGAIEYFAKIYKETSDPIEKRKVLIKRNTYFKRIMGDDFKVVNWQGQIKEKQIANRNGDLNLTVSLAPSMTISGYNDQINADYFNTNIKIGSYLFDNVLNDLSAGKLITFSGRFVKNWQPGFNGNHHNLSADNMFSNMNDESMLMTDLNLFFKFESIEIAP